jgi:hypothetical protein
VCVRVLSMHIYGLPARFSFVRDVTQPPQRRPVDQSRCGIIGPAQLGFDELEHRGRDLYCADCDRDNSDMAVAASRLRPNIASSCNVRRKERAFNVCLAVAANSEL